ncbi:MAG TPA: TolC family protein, partial [Bryobacteraceae bacterium]|nr:TolC family protein [Bryobacteraceae bacterium]
MKRSIALLAACAFFSSCAVGPNYKRPKIDVPEQFRGTEAAPAQASLADTKWAGLFADDTLNKLIGTAIGNNFDLRAAVERIAQARANFTVQRSALFPFLDGQASFNASQTPTGGSLPFLPAGNAIKNAFSQVGAALSWEVDFFGRIRRLTESARAQYLATEEGRRAVLVTLISDVTTSYFQILELEQELDVSRKTRDIAVDNLRLVKLRFEQGAAS